MEFILGLLISWPALIILAFIAILTDHNDRSGWTAIFAVAIGVLLYSLFSLTWQEMLIGVGAYIPLGVVWSIFRFKRYCDSIVAKVKTSNHYGHSDAKRDLEVSRNMDNIVYWAVAWPFSLLASFLGDFIDLMHSLIRNVFGKTFAKISQTAMAKVDKI